MSERIDDYALIGDRRSTALVCRSGSIDWLCWPRFDSDACFAALLGDERHGRWLLAPQSGRDCKITRRYRPDTLILETRHACPAGSALVVDLMPIGTAHRAIIRRVVGESGELDMGLDFSLRFDYGKIVPWLRLDRRVATGMIGPDLLVLRSQIDLDRADHDVTARFRIKAGETVSFVLQYGLSFEPQPEPIDTSACIADTERYWADWVRPAKAGSTWPQVVKRSLITLQSLTQSENGGIVAAPTLGLPEIPHGSANWDYRYCWLRDSTLALDAFIHAGFRKEAVAWRDWLLRAIAGEPAHMRTMYRCDGARHIKGYELPWLPGYDGARPVMLGNAAATQVQLDIYGEVLDALLLAEQAGIDEARPWDVRVEEAIVDHIERIWDEPDQGIWESRGPPQHFTYSKVMAWVGVDRLLKTSSARQSIGDHRLHELENLRDTIHTRVCRDGFNPSLNSFVQSFGSDQLDASLLRLPLVGFLPVSDPRIAGTIDAVERLLVEDGLVRRHLRNKEDVDEGAFLACTCWFADCRIRQGRQDEARMYFERVLATGNDVGLFAEEWDNVHARMLGNFPQALTHLALINTALRFDEAGPHGSPR